jgi:hypothetical protein
VRTALFVYVDLLDAGRSDEAMAMLETLPAFQVDACFEDFAPRCPDHVATTRALFRKALRAAGFDKKQIRREERIVDGLATGRLVEEKGEQWEAAWPPAIGREGPFTREHAHRRAKEFDDGIVIRTTRRIRRAR